MLESKPCQSPKDCGRNHCGCDRHIPLTKGECQICRPKCERHGMIEPCVMCENET